jgi:hypothetical protein
MADMTVGRACSGPSRNGRREQAYVNTIPAWERYAQQQGCSAGRSLPKTFPLTITAKTSPTNRLSMPIVAPGGVLFPAVLLSFPHRKQHVAASLTTPPKARPTWLACTRGQRL